MKIFYHRNLDTANVIESSQRIIMQHHHQQCLNDYVVGYPINDNNGGSDNLFITDYDQQLTLTTLPYNHRYALESNDSLPLFQWTDTIVAAEWITSTIIAVLFAVTYPHLQHLLRITSTFYRYNSNRFTCITTIK
jgi:hypothetical protein